MSQNQMCSGPEDGLPLRPVPKGNTGSSLTKVAIFSFSCVLGMLVAAVWTSATTAGAIRTLQQDIALSKSNSAVVRDLQARIQVLETSLVEIFESIGRNGSDDDVELFHMDEELLSHAGGGRSKRSPETLRRPSRYMRRPVPIYNKAYGIDLKDGKGLQLYSSLQGPIEENSLARDSTEQKSKTKEATDRPRRPPPASFLKNGVRRKRPQLKSLQRRRDPTPSGGLVTNKDVLYRESLYKNTPGDDDWNAAVSRVQQGLPAPAALTQPQPSAPVFVTQTQRDRPRKRPRKRNSNRRRRRGSRITAAHFNGLPAAAGGTSGGMWEGAEWMEGLGLMSRYRTGGDHVLVAEPGIYLLYAQVKYAYGRSSGFDVKVNGRSEASCSQLLNNSQPTTCHTSVVAYLPKNSVVRVESNSPNSPVLSLGDGEQASLGLVKLLEAPDTYHKLFTD